MNRHDLIKKASKLSKVKDAFGATYKAAGKATSKGVQTVNTAMGGKLRTFEDNMVDRHKVKGIRGIFNRSNNKALKKQVSGIKAMPRKDRAEYVSKNFSKSEGKAYNKLHKLQRIAQLKTAGGVAIASEAAYEGNKYLKNRTPRGHSYE